MSRTDESLTFSCEDDFEMSKVQSEFIFQIHKLVKGKRKQPFVNGGQELRRILSPGERKQFENKIMETFRNKTNTLSKELQRILADDLLTAFENRLATLMRIQSKHDR